MAAYRMPIGGEPENDTVVMIDANEANDLRPLRQLFVNSAVFREKYETLHGPCRLHESFSGPPMVQASGTSDQLVSFLVTQQWPLLGETVPHWTVLTHDSNLLLLQRAS